ncbi:MAG: FtsX-like permease family protein, partial [bacterium]
YSLMLATIAALVLIIACFNFMTLATGRSVRRAVEVGMRKVIGATRLQVMRQFWGEAILLSVLAMLLGIGMAELSLPAFNTLAQKELSLFVFDNPATLMILFGIMLVTGLFAGSYPAVVLSRFQPIQVLKGENRIAGRSRLTRLLVVLQYALSIALMIATLVISRQLHFLRTKELGYNQEQVLVISVPGERFSERYKTKLAQYDRIISAAASDRSFTSGWQTRSLKTDQGEWQTVRLIRIDPDYLETLGIDLIAGRNFSATHPADSMEAVIVNEAFVKTFGWDSPLDKRLEGLATREGMQPPAVIGVVKDFHIDKLDRNIEPLILHTNPDNHGLYYVFVRIRPDGIPPTIDLLKTTWESVAPNAPFNYSFLDENLEAQYRNEERWQKIITYA